jgi:hypothetical protein
MGQIGGSANAARRIHCGSNSSGHQQLPIAAIVVIRIVPSGSAASRVVSRLASDQSEASARRRDRDATSPEPSGRSLKSSFRLGPQRL